HAGSARLLPLCPEPVARGRPSGDAARTAAETAPLSELGGATTEPHAGRTPAVEVVDVRRRFGAREALAGASFTVVQGELFGLLGPPSTGLDPAARRDFLAELRALRDADGVTVLLTTHHMEEAERCDRVAILDRGRVVALGAPDALKAAVGGDVLVVETPTAEVLRDGVRARFGVAGTLVDGTLRLEHPRAHELVRELVEAFPGAVRTIT